MRELFDASGLQLLQSCSERYMQIVVVVRIALGSCPTSSARQKYDLSGSLAAITDYFSRLNEMRFGSRRANRAQKTFRIYRTHTLVEKNKDASPRNFKWNEVWDSEFDLSVSPCNFV